MHTSPRAQVFAAASRPDLRSSPSRTWAFRLCWRAVSVFTPMPQFQVELIEPQTFLGPVPFSPGGLK